MQHQPRTTADHWSICNTVADAKDDGSAVDSFKHPVESVHSLHYRPIKGCAA